MQINNKKNNNIKDANYFRMEILLAFSPSYLFIVLIV
jgi:hypothetical protein